MCNARNHPPGCNCGWGGGWHQGGYGGSGNGSYRGLFSALTRYTSNSPTALQGRTHDYTSEAASYMSQQERTRSELRAGWVNPNAKCPVCGGGVYFYESPDGGRVYFDELGPPWPKHLCTDQSSPSPAIKRHGVGDTRWPLNGWHPLHDFQVSLIASGSLHRISGRSGEQPLTITFRLDRPVIIEIARFRQRYDDVLELSLLARDCDAPQWLICEGEAKLSPSYPPVGMLAVLASINDEPDSSQFDAGEEHNANESAASVGLESMRSALAVRHLKRVEEIDEEIPALLNKIAELNDEKTRIIQSLLMPVADDLR